MKKIIQLTLFVYIIAVFINVMVLPPLNVISIDNFILPFASVVVFLNYRKNKLFWMSILLVALIVITGAISNLLNGGITIDEMLWSIRWLKLLIVGWSAYYLFVNHTRIIEKLMLIGFLCMALINCLQLIHLNVIIDLYSPKDQLSDLLKYSMLDGRVYGTMINPNNNGLIMALFGVYFFSSKIKFKYVYLIISVLLLITTQSRTAFLAFISVVLITLAYNYLRNNRKGLILLFTSSILGYVLLIQLKFTNLSSLLNGTAFRSNSLRTRLDVIDKTWDINKSSFWFGKGKVANIPDYLGYSIDNDYAFIFLEYGFIGLLSILLLIIFLILLSASNNYKIGSLGLIWIMLVCGLTNLSFTNLEIGPIFLVLFAGTSSFFNQKEPSQQLSKQE